MNFVGNKWYKCDFHLHSMQSNCYKNKTDTIEDWVKEIKNKNIDCIAITDHNDYRKINDIKLECNKNGIVVFPGVEVTCDTSKIHILVLFNEACDEDMVRDFLTIIGIDSQVINDDQKFTSKNVIDVCRIAKEKGAVVIAAHIDEFNGLSLMSDANLKKLINNKYVDGFQVKHSNIWEETMNDTDKFILIRKKYANTIEDSDIKKWKIVYMKIKANKLPMLTFSDNPSGEYEATHGLWGVGKEFTWVKMGESASLEGFKQALLSPELRIRTFNECKDIPERSPDFWIKSIRAYDTKINKDKVVAVNFSPHLNTIIGGRGSGKSSIIRLLYGAFESDKIIDIKSVINDQKQFYKKTDKDEIGIFNNNSRIEIDFVKDDIEYCLLISNIIDHENQNRELYIVKGGEKQRVESETFEKFSIQVYPQKSIYEIAKRPNDLLNIIDNEINGITIIKEKYLNYSNELLYKLQNKRSVMSIIKQEAVIKDSIDDLQKKIDYYNKNGLKDIIGKRQGIKNDNDLIANITKRIDMYREEYGNIYSSMPTSNEISSINDKDAKCVVEKVIKNIGAKIDTIKNCIQEISNDISEVKEFIKSDEWKRKSESIEKEYEMLVENQGVEITDINKIIDKQKELNNSLKEISISKKKIDTLEAEIKTITDERNTCSNCIREKRKEFINNILNDSNNIKVSIDDNGNREKFCENIMNIIQKNGATIKDDINVIADKVFVNKDISKFRDIVNRIRNFEEISGISKICHRTILDLDDDTVDKLLTYELEDKLVFEYKPTLGKKFRALNAASAGQKAAAILTFIASYGDKPLLLDQPEDDLDNKMVYELVVRMIQKSKQKRQLIIATHNANIPVNGDSEYIVAMNSDRVSVDVKYSGTIDNEEIRNEICDVMEGSKYAFEMRAKKYHMNIIN